MSPFGAWTTQHPSHVRRSLIQDEEPVPKALPEVGVLTRMRFLTPEQSFVVCFKHFSCVPPDHLLGGSRLRTLIFSSGDQGFWPLMRGVLRVRWYVDWGRPVCKIYQLPPMVEQRSTIAWFWCLNPKSYHFYSWLALMPIQPVLEGCSRSHIWSWFEIHIQLLGYAALHW